MKRVYESVVKDHFHSNKQQVVFDLPSNERALEWLSKHLIDEKSAPATIIPADSLFAFLV